MAFVLCDADDIQKHQGVIRQEARLVVTQTGSLRYSIDWDVFDKAFHSGGSRTKMFLLCNPHNPGGMVWKPEELKSLADFCTLNNIMVVSDEIHSDLLFPGQRHTPWPLVTEQSGLNSMVCMAPSKTFNVAGLSTSFTVIPDSRLKKVFDSLMNTLHINTGNIPGKVALEAAFTFGEAWLDQLMVYVEGNYRFLEDFLAARLPQVSVMKPEATFLVWLDFRAYGMNDRELSRFLVEKAGVGLNNGARFGTGGDGFQRLNIACPRSVLQEGLERISAAFSNFPGSTAQLP